MKRSIISNITGLDSRPFLPLRELSFVEYEEHRPTENARRLHEGEVDIALIPSNEFAQHGGYVGLDFGLGINQRSDCLFLYTRGPIHDVRTIYLYRDASSSALLLRFLLEERWRCAPRLVRSSAPVSIEALGPNEGTLILYENLTPIIPPADCVATDLVTEWFAHTGQPFTFLIWATRPGALTYAQHQELNEALHRCVKARVFLAREHAPSLGADPDHAAALLENNFEYYLEKPMRDGLNAMFRRGFDQGILPRMLYQHPMFTLLKSHAAPFHELTIHEVLNDAINGKRISVIDVVRLAQEASLADLGLAADAIRSRMTIDRTVKFMALIDHRDLNQPAALEEEISVMVEQGVNHILLVPRSLLPADLDRWEQLIHQLKTKLAIEIEGFSIPMIIAVARARGIPVREVAARLVTAGLNAVPSIGGGMLIQRILERRGEHSYTVQEWIECATWLHSVSARTSCFLSFDPADSWEERMVHLHKLRSLQDITPGFHCFHVEVAPWVKGTFPVDDYLRCLAVSRLFLDNIHTVQEPSVGASEVAGALGLCFGANELRFRASEKLGTPTEDSVELLRTLWEAGIDLDRRVIAKEGEQGVH